MSYAPKCFALAQTFLADVMPPSKRAEELADLLAQELQTTIEDFIEAHGCDSELREAEGVNA